MKSKSVKFRKIVWVIFLLGGSILSVPFDIRFFPDIFSSLTFHIITLVLGLLLLRFVFTVAKNTGRTLAKYGRKGNLPRFETNVLVTEGVYSYMRHPMHFGLLFFPLAIALIIGSPTFILFVAPVEMLFMIIMIITYEEKEAEKKFGDKYLEYKRKVPFFCIRAECIKALLKTVIKEKNK